MNYDILSLLVFYLLLYFYYVRHKDKFVVQAKILFIYKTKIGLKFMDSFSKRFPGILKVLGFMGVVTGFAGMGFIFFYLVKETLNFLLVPSATPPLAPVLPGVSIPGVPVLSFWHWIIAIFIVATLHEGAHGVIARLQKVKIKSSGFAFFGPQLVAFVEPDEKQLKKAKPYKQMSIYSAGPFSNILTGFIFLALLLFVISPLYSSMYEVKGVNVLNVSAVDPLMGPGLAVPFTIESVNDAKLVTPAALKELSAGLVPGQEISIAVRGKGTYNIKAGTDPDNSTHGIIGISNFEFKAGLKDSVSWMEFFLPAIRWINRLVAWLFMISVGVALFNLLPFGPVDGGRLFYTAALAVFKKEKRAKRAWNFVSAVCLILIFINLLPWIIKLFSFIIAKIALLVTLIAAL